MKSRNLAILFVDIAGYTERTGQQSRKESAAWLRRYEELILPLLGAFGGRKIKAIGDAYLCTFVSPTNALLFGMAVHDRLFEYNRSAPPAERIDVRISMNVGEVRLHRGDVYGEPVNIAARLEGLTPQGEIWFSEAAYLAMTKSEVPTEEVGVRELKGIHEPVKIYRVPRDADYRLLGLSEEQQQDKEDLVQGSLDYPYKGIGLGRAREKGLVMSLAGVQSRVKGARSLAAEGLRSVGLRIVKVPPRIWMPLAGVVVALLGILLLWPAGQFAKVEKALDQGRFAAALALMEKHPRRDTPSGMAMQAHVLLSQKDPSVERAGNLLMQVCKKDPTKLSESRVRADLVACLDQSNAGSIAEFISKTAFNQLQDELIAASRRKRYWLRWNAIHLLLKNGAADEVDLGYAYIQDLRYAGSCSSRKRAAKKLAEMKDTRALPALREAGKRSFLENLCMGDTLEDAIREIRR
ncbi:MAG TPA: adenylate/guanylate cyclase domain-containing protein [Myxococcota bacterium]|nr:adenylate/guanylate cyclase domain-containing protein [Myxococcota bacterium]